MKFKAIFAAAALAATAFSTQAMAADEEGISYEELTTCAAFVLLEAQVYDTDDASSEDKATAQTFYEQAAALTVAASVIHKRDSDSVTKDVKSINSKMIESISDEASAKNLIATHQQNCNALGKAAQEALAKK